MTDKRYFALIGEDGYVYPVFFDSENEDKEIDVNIVVDLLNENEQLRHDATILIQSNQDYRNENEELKQQIEKVAEANECLLTQKRRWEEMSDEYAKLYEENEQLKERNKKLYTEIFEMRTNIALERTEINRETYTAKKSAKEFLDDLEKW